MQEMNEKKLLRRNIIRLRNSLNNEEVKFKSGVITSKILDLREFADSRFIMCYVSFANEVDTLELINICLKSGKRVAVPVVADSTDCRGEMVVSEIYSLDDVYVRNSFGILEPEKSKLNIVDPHEINMSIIPGIAFDLSGQRIGYGGGYYDRFLRKAGCGFLRLGVAFDLQIMPRIPVEMYDEPVDIIISEERVIVREERIIV